VLKGPAIVSTILLVLAFIIDGPYIYYLFLCLVVGSSALYLALHAAKKMKWGWALPMVSITVLFGVLLPVYGPKSGWTSLSLLVAPLFLISLGVLRKKKQSPYLVAIGVVTGSLLFGVTLISFGLVFNVLTFITIVWVIWRLLGKIGSEDLIITGAMGIMAVLAIGAVSIVTHVIYGDKDLTTTIALMTLFLGFLFRMNLEREWENMSVVWKGIHALVTKMEGRRHS